MRPQLQLLTLAIAVTLGTSAAAAVKPEQAAIATRAKQFVAANPTLAAIAGGDAVEASSVVEGPNGTRHVRFKRSHGGLPVIGGDFVVHTRASGRQSVTGTLSQTTRPGSLRAAISADDAMLVAGALFPSSVDKVPTARLVVFAHQVPRPVLAYEVRIAGMSTKGEPEDMLYYIDANTEQLLAKWSALQTQRRPLPPPPPSGAAQGGGQSLYLGTVPMTTTRVGGQTGFKLIDASRGNGQIIDARNRPSTHAATWGVEMTDRDNQWGNGTTSDRATVAVDAYYGIGATWDYYQEVHGRNGIFGDGRGVRSYVHVGVNWGNAGWDGTSMYYGNGDGRNFKPLVALDVAGHEMSHGVVTATADLVYSGESGGLNEATADIFGTMVERHAAARLGRTFNWTIGEDAAGPELPTGTALRYMFKPSLDLFHNAAGQPVVSADCYSDAVAGMDVHHSSGVANRFFYLLSEGAAVPAGWDLTPADLVCNGNTALAGIGADAAEQIWYLALTAYFTSGTGYGAARVGTLQAAADLFGEGSAQQQAVAASWDAVNVQ